MNTLESYSTTSPYGKVEECAKLTIEEVGKLFTLTGVMMSGQKYTFSFWVKGDVESSMTVCGGIIPVTSEWVRYGVSFTAGGEDLVIAFDTVGTYYLFNSQLEIGNKATDWTPSPDDVDDAVSNAAQDASNAQQTAGDAAGRVAAAEAAINLLRDRIAMLVVDENGQTMMEQTGEGWSFNFGEFRTLMNDLSQSVHDLTDAHNDTKDKLDKIDEIVNDPDTNEYVRIHTYNDQPCISLSESDSDYQARITNTDMDAPNFNVKNELRHYDFVWKRRANGNLGLMWTEVTE